MMGSQNRKELLKWKSGIIFSVFSSECRQEDIIISIIFDQGSARTAILHVDVNLTEMKTPKGLITCPNPF